MQRFAIKIDKSVKARLKNCCRLCGIDNPNQIEILNAAEWIDLTIDDEVSLSRKIAECVGIEVMKNDKMPQRICALCIDKINDFYEFRDMCQATNIQTRKLLNLPDTTKIKAPKKVTIKTDEDAIESILGISGSDTQAKAEPVLKTGKKTKKATASTSSTATAANENRFRGMTKREIEITLELERIKKEEEDEMMAQVAAQTATTTATTTTSRTKNGKKRKSNTKVTFDTPLLAPKEPNQRERKREMEQKRIEKKRKLDTKAKAPVPKKIKKEPGISCLVCEERFEKVSFRDTHLQAWHRPTISFYGCATCHEQFPTLEDYIAHNDWHCKNNVPHKCAICNATFPKLINFQSHVSACVDSSFSTTASFAGNIFCGMCNLEFETQNLYDWHACFIGDNSRCPQCQRIFIKRAVLLKHMFKCTGPLGTVAVPVAPQPKKVKGKAKKKTAKGVQKAKNKPHIPSQNSFKFEPETIIEQNVDGDDEAFEAVDNSFMDTHFADSDTEFEPSNSIITSTGLDMPSTPAKELEQDSGTINPDESLNPAMITSKASAAGVRTNVELPLLECRVKLEPLDVASLAPPVIPVNPEPVIDPPQRPLTVPPLTIRIKKEVIRPGYGDEFDVNLARNIKQERVDETYELAGSSTSAHPNPSNIHKKSKQRDKLKKLYKKPALLAIKIKQERMERETNNDDDYGESYSDYSMPPDDYSMASDVAAVNSTFDSNPLPIITQIHSVIDASIPAASNPSINQAVPSIAGKPFISQSTHNLVPFMPIRIKSEFQRPLSPPPDTIDSTSISQNQDHEQQHESENLFAGEGLRQPDSVQHPAIQQPDSEQQSVTQQPDTEQKSGETVDSTVVQENANNDIGNECTHSECTTNDHQNDNEREHENTENLHSLQLECDTSSSLNENVKDIANGQTAEMVNSTAENDNDLHANQTAANVKTSDPQICSSANIEPIPHETCENDGISPPIETVCKAQDPNAFIEEEACQKNSDQVTNENEIACDSAENNPNIEYSALHSVNIDIGEEQELSENFEANIEHDGAATNTEMLQPIDEICDVRGTLGTDVTNENSNISPIDFIENANDESLNFIDQLVHEVADKMDAPQTTSEDVDKVMIQRTATLMETSANLSFVAAEFNYNVGSSNKSAEHNESNTETVESSTVNDTILALSDIPDIDYDLLPVLNANACPPIDNTESGADSNTIDVSAEMLNADANIQNEQPKLSLN